MGRCGNLGNPGHCAENRVAVSAGQTVNAHFLKAFNRFDRTPPKRPDANGMSVRPCENVTFSDR